MYIYMYIYIIYINIYIYIYIYSCIFTNLQTYLFLHRLYPNPCLYILYFVFTMFFPFMLIMASQISTGALRNSIY